MRMRMFKSLVFLSLAICLVAPTLHGQQRADMASVAEEGAGTETFVLISGMVGGVAGYRRLATLLVAHGYRVIVVDPYGLSLDSMDVSFAAMARRVDAVLNARGVGGARVVAHSQGAGVALRLAARSPDRVRALYFLDAGAQAVNRGPTLSASLRLVPLLTRVPAGRSFVRGRFVAALRRNAARQQWLDLETQRAYTEPVLSSIDRAVAMAFRLANAEEPESLVTVLRRVHTPVTVLLGAAPHETDAGPEELAALALLNPPVRIENLAGIGHFPHEEAPNELLPLLVAPIATAAPARRSREEEASPFRY